MADPTKISEKTETTDIADADIFPIVKAADTTETYRISGWNLINAVGAKSGWITVQDACTYVSATSFRIAGDYTSIIGVGDRLLITNNGQKFFCAIAVSYSSPNTTVTVAAGSAYALANTTITAAYSHSNAVAFPDWFNLTAPTYTTTGTAFTNQPTTNIAKFRLAGRKLDIKLKGTCHATSGGTGVFIATFTAAQFPAIVAPGAGVAKNFSAANNNGNCWMSTTAPLVLNFAKYDNSAIATNSEVFYASLSAEI